MFQRRSVREILRKWLKVLGFLLACYIAFALGVMAMVATTANYYDSIEKGENLAAILARAPLLDARDIGVETAVAAIPPAWLPERTGTVGGILAARGVALEFLHPAFVITVILDDRDRVLIKYPSYE